MQIPPPRHAQHRRQRLAAQARRNTVRLDAGRDPAVTIEGLFDAERGACSGTRALA